MELPESSMAKIVLSIRLLESSADELRDVVAQEIGSNHALEPLERPGGSEGDEPAVRPEDDGVPPLEISADHRREFKDPRITGSDRLRLEDEVDRAQWLIDSIDLRRKTVERVVRVIAQWEREFFESRIPSSRRLRVQEVAAQLDLHPSTFTRAIAGKNLVSPRGTIPLRAFFSSVA